MSKLEKRLILCAIVFVIVYLGAAAVTLHKRFEETDTAPTRYESDVPTPSEGRLGMVELLLPMLVLLTLAVTYAAAKKKRAAQMAKLELETTDDDVRDIIRSDPLLSAEKQQTANGRTAKPSRTGDT